MEQPSLKPNNFEDSEGEEEKLLHFDPESVAGPDGIIENLQLVVDQRTGKFVYVGDPNNPDDTDRWIRSQKESGRDVGQIEGGTVMPGMTDAHEHAAGYSSIELMEAVDVSSAKSREELVAKLSEAARNRDPRKPLVAVGLDTSEVSGLTAEMLEETVGDREVAVCDSSFHGGVVSPKMAENIQKLMRDREREPAGYLKENGAISEEYALAALEVAESHFTIEEIKDMTMEKLDSWVNQGITSVHDMLSFTDRQFRAMLRARDEWEQSRNTEFPIKKFYLRDQHIRKVREDLETENLSGLLTRDEFPDLVGLKLLADGSIGTRTAQMTDPYEDTGGTGEVFDSSERIAQALEVADREGLSSVAMHAIGDEGIQRALKTAKRWSGMQEGGLKDSGADFRIEHFELPLPLEETLGKAKELGVWVTPQPNFMHDIVYKDRLGEGRTRMICPHKEILDNDVNMMFGTDGMPDSMLYAIYLATHAQHEHQRLSLSEAITAASLASANFEGDNRGSFEEGNKADIVVADSDMLGKLAADGSSDVNPEAAQDTIDQLNSQVRRVYKNGQVASKMAEE